MKSSIGAVLVLLPLASFLVGLLLIKESGLSLTRVNGSSWRRAFILAAIGWSTAGTLLLELLSLVSGITRLNLTIAWSAILVVLLVVFVRRGRLPNWWSISEQPLSLAERLVLAGVAVYVFVLFTVAVVSPPNNVDSLLYHMTRVANWVQNASLRHYAANYGHQLFMPIGAESQILQLRILWGGDQLSNLIQWFCMVGSLIGVSEIAGLFRAPRAGQLLAAAFGVTIPMGILQATSTQNDYVVTFWLVCLSYLVVVDRSEERPRGNQVFLGLALGLSLLAKATAYLYAAPLVAWHLVSILRKEGVRSAVKAGLMVAGLAMLLNLGHWARNYATYGGPLGPRDIVSGFVRGVPGSDSVESALFSPRAVQAWAADQYSRVATTLARNIMTPSFALSARIFAWMPRLPLGLPAGFESEMLTSIWNHEDTAGNPLHLALVPITLSLVGFGSAKGSQQRGLFVARYMASALGGLLLIAIVLDNGPSLFGLRFQLPFFVIWSPVVGFSISKFLSKNVVRLISGGLLLVSVPWLLFNNTRPVFGRQPYVTRTPSIFSAPQSEIMFAMAPHFREPYTAVTNYLKAVGCTEVGLRIDSSDPGYLFWWLLSAPESGLRIESISTYYELEKYLDVNFEPCAVICTTCSEESRFPGLVQQISSDHVRLYVQEGSSWHGGSEVGSPPSH